MLHDSRRQIGDGQGPHRGPQARELQAKRAAIYARLRPAPAGRPRTPKNTHSRRQCLIQVLMGGVGRWVTYFSLDFSYALLLLLPPSFNPLNLLSWQTCLSAFLIPP